MTRGLDKIAQVIADELNLRVTEVERAIRLMDAGDTVPFIARYCKEETAGLSDIQLRQLSERLTYLREFNERREVILTSVSEQGLLTKELATKIRNAHSKISLEDIYLPYLPKRQTKAVKAKEAGLEPLAEVLFNDPSLDPETTAQAYINEEIDPFEQESDGGVSAALTGAQHIIVEKLAENADLLANLRQSLWAQSILQAKTISDKKQASAAVFADYKNYAKPIRKIPAHHIQALQRGQREKALRLSFKHSEDPLFGESEIASFFHIEDKGRAADSWLGTAVKIAWKNIVSKLENEMLKRIRELADKKAIGAFAHNFKDLLLSAPAGLKVVLGIDPGIRNGMKLAVVDVSGKLLDYATIFPLAPNNDWHGSIVTLAKMAIKHSVELISIGNGTASRDAVRLVGDLMKMYPDLNLQKTVVNAAGVSVYSTSPIASEELPDIDVTIRGAVSIARRLQDPLAELVKIEPKSIGVGQYQHDVNQNHLAQRLEGVVEDCVNAVGVDLNTASIALLSRVSGLNESLAKNIVNYRFDNGLFKNRQQLLSVAKIGAKEFEQAAGFLRIPKADNLLDASAVHPEAYSVVEMILADNKVTLKDVMGSKEFFESIDAARYVDDKFGLPTIRDILMELEKPGRDPRPKFRIVNFKEGIENIKDLEVGMLLEGVVSNVTNFGVFVDIGVHQDGMIHISELSNSFVSEPADIVKAGDILSLKVVGVDLPRKRISLSTKLEAKGPKTDKINKPPKVKNVEKVKAAKIKGNKIFNSAMADALAKLKKE